MKSSLTSIQDLNKNEIQSLISRAIELHSGKKHPGEFPKKPTLLWFDEPSTRTSLSFQVACQTLKIPFYFIGGTQSSLLKKESWEDTLDVIHSLGIKLLIVRQPEAGLWQKTSLPENLFLINAGDGPGEHPTQALGDLATLALEWDDFAEKKILIIGDNTHSRVSHSLTKALQLMGSHVTHIGGQLPQSDPLFGQIPFTDSISDYESLLTSADAIVTLRWQKERKSSSDKNMTNIYQIDTKREALLPSHCQILAPGPVMWGDELSHETKNSKKNKILTQVKLGLEIRKVVIERLLSGEQSLDSN